jgi:hypothetical protein
VQALFALIRSSALPYFPDAERGGAGVPDFQRIPGEKEISATLGPMSASGFFGGWSAAHAGGPSAYAPLFTGGESLAAAAGHSGGAPPWFAASNGGLQQALMSMRAAGFIV